VTAVVGLDLSLTSSGLARITWGRDRTVVTETWHRGEAGVTTLPDPADRCTALHRLKADIVEWAHPAHLVVVEKLVPNPVSRSTNERAALWYLTVSALVSRGSSVVEVHPGTLKRYATGRGGAPKQEMRAAAKANFPGVVTACSDEDDALWLAALGVQVLDGPLEHLWTAERREITAGIRASPFAA
jgi:Holliday junction resolvasome RuvABC endonuclease subunit